MSFNSQYKRPTAQIYTGRPGSDMSIENLGRAFTRDLSLGKERIPSQMDELTESMSSMNLGYGSRGPTYTSTNRNTFKAGKKYKKSNKRKKSRKHRKTRRHKKI